MHLGVPDPQSSSCRKNCRFVLALLQLRGREGAQYELAEYLGACLGTSLGLEKNIEKPSWMRTTIKTKFAASVYPLKTTFNIFVPFCAINCFPI